MMDDFEFLYGNREKADAASEGAIDLYGGNLNENQNIKVVRTHNNFSYYYWVDSLQKRCQVS